MLLPVSKTYGLLAASCCPTHTHAHNHTPYRIKPIYIKQFEVNTDAQWVQK